MTTFSGKKLHMEHFTGTTDGSGDLTVTLSSTPANTVTQFIVDSKTTNVIPKVQSITGTSLVVRFYKFQYSKMASTATDAGNLPTGVTSAGVVSSTSTAPTGGNVITGTPYWYSTPAGHAHEIKKQYIHTHNITSTTTDTTQAVFGSGAVELLVLYAVT